MRDALPVRRAALCCAALLHRLLHCLPLLLAACVLLLVCQCTCAPQHVPTTTTLPCVSSAACSLTVRSACVKGVHPAASERVLIAHFGTCGYIQRITFLRWVGGWVGWRMGRGY